MPNRNRDTQHILPEMFDVRPTKASGDVDWDRVRDIRRAGGQRIQDDFSVPRVRPDEIFPLPEIEQPLLSEDRGEDFFHTPAMQDDFFSYADEAPKQEDVKVNRISRITWPIKWFGFLLFVITVGVAGREMFVMKGRVLGESETGYRSLSSAITALQAGDISKSDRSFETAYQSFSSAWDHLGIWQLGAIDALQYVPFLSQASSGKNVIEAGRHIARAGYLLNDTASSLSFSGNPIAQQDTSFLVLMDQIGDPLTLALPELEEAQESLDRVSLQDIPEDKRTAFEKAQKALPIAVSAARSFLEKRDLLADMLGGNGPRKYLFLFQNNHEMRPTGGFIGSYGVLEMKDGKIRDFFVDGIFNPDGQLKEKVVPPEPLQKVSAAWSLHDSNWFPDFPTSAKKAMYFYEKTGGPTVDGVITLTPDIVRDLVGVFGPIEMKEYGVTLDRDNFVAAVQEEVEVKYDREENRPKKILSDLAPILLERIFSTKDPKKLFSILEILTDHLNRKNILLYARDKDLEKSIDALGWSGRVEETPLDYLSVINTNINGYKTDAVVRESIFHEADIRSDGSVVDTVRITRRHEGGNTPYEWWNKVNADYLRVYVPEGSKLLSVRGQTRETVLPPLDYDALGFTRDADILKGEKSTSIDTESGTRITDEFGKTSFGNWVYVSPGETAVIEYKYRLPFSVAAADHASYSVLFQKQSGSRGSDVESVIDFPSSFRIEWQTGVHREKGSALRAKSELSRDMFSGVVWKLHADAVSGISFQE